MRRNPKPLSAAKSYGFTFHQRRGPVFLLFFFGQVSIHPYLQNAGVMVNVTHTEAALSLNMHWISTSRGFQICCDTLCFLLQLRSLLLRKELASPAWRNHVTLPGSPGRSRINLMTLGRQMRHLQREENKEGGGETRRWQEINKGKRRQQIKGLSEEDEKGRG